MTKDPALIPATVHFSLLFPVDKKDGAFRPILDLSFLNTFILTPGLRMETVSHIVACIHEQRWATSLDITDAFLSVWMHPIFQRYLCFVLGGTVYMFRRLPFGLTTAPWAFSRLMRPIKHCLRGRRVHVNSFIDDFIILALSKAQGSLHTLWTENLLRWLGFNINESKSVRTPLQLTEYLGVLLNLRTLTLALPLEKVNLILARTSQVSSSPSTTRRQLESLVGLLNFAAPLLPLGRLYLAPIIIWMNSHTVPLKRDQSTPVDASLRTALKPFLNRIYLVDHVSCHPPSPSLDLQTDASDYGWSGVIDGHRVRGYWTPLESSAHINVREMKGLFNALKFFHPCLEGKCIRIHTDSMVVLFCLKRQSSLHSPRLNAVTRDLILFCHRKNISFVPVHIHGVLNVLADQGSRHLPVSTEWMLDPVSFESICREFSFTPQVDLFATRATCRFACYVSPCPDQEAFHQDALDPSFNWNQFQVIYAFPPPNLMPLIIPKILAFKGAMLLIAPLKLTHCWTLSLQQRAHSWKALPEDYYLYQMVRGDFTIMESWTPYPLYVFHLHPVP